jgi:hypothetical protein
MPAEKVVYWDGWGKGAARKMRTEGKSVGVGVQAGHLRSALNERRDLSRCWWPISGNGEGADA